MLLARHYPLAAHAPSSCRQWAFSACTKGHQRRRALVVTAAASGSMCTSPDRRAAVWWVRRDLRLTDNAALAAAVAGSFDYLLPCYVLDERCLQTRPAHGVTALPQLGPHRCRLLLEGLHGLRASLTLLGSGLAMRRGPPEQVLPSLLQQLLQHSHDMQPNKDRNAKQDQAAAPTICHVELLFHEEPLLQSAALEADVEGAFREAAEQLGLSCGVQRFWGMTLYHPDDLPYAAYQASATGHGKQKPQQEAHQDTDAKQESDPCFSERPNADQQRYQHMPSVMTNFCKETEGHAPIRAALPAPRCIPPLPPGWRTDSSECSIEQHSHHHQQEQQHVRFEPQQQQQQQGHGQQLDQQHQQPQQQGQQQLQLLGSIPTDALSLYPADALAEIEALTGQSFAALVQPACSGLHHEHSAWPFTASETAALRHLRRFVWGDEEGGAALIAPLASAPLRHFTNTRMQAAGVDSSAKLSPFLALGCLSPRTVVEEVAAAAAAAQAAGEPLDRDCQTLVMHMHIRDFFIFTALKAGNAIASAAGMSPREPAAPEWSCDTDVLKRWASGTSGLPFIDACMREIGATGWMSNRGRQNVASLLTKELTMDWRMGAEVFGCLLLDHEPAVNYANWAYVAGVGNDPRDRRFKTVTQGEKYDPEASLAATWLPELAHLPAQQRHRPWEAAVDTTAAVNGHGGALQSTYPAPMVDVSGQIGAGPRPAGCQQGRRSHGAKGVKHQLP